MGPGASGAGSMYVFNVAGSLDPQELFATTDMLPPVEPGSVCMISVLELPSHPSGKVQVYEVAAGSLGGCSLVSTL